MKETSKDKTLKELMDNFNEITDAMSDAIEGETLPKSYETVSSNQPRIYIRDNARKINLYIIKQFKSKSVG